MGLGRQHPAEEDLLLGWRAIRIDLDVSASRRQPLDFAHCADALGAVEIVHHIDRDRRRKAAVGERQLDAISEMQPPDDLRLAVHQRIFGDVETEGFEPRAGLHQVFDEKPLAGADIRARGRRAASRNARSCPRRSGAIAHRSDTRHSPCRATRRSIRAILPGDPDIRFALCPRALLDIALGPRIAAQKIYLSHSGCLRIAIGPQPMVPSRLPPSVAQRLVRTGRSAADTRR